MLPLYNCHKKEEEAPLNKNSANFFGFKFEKPGKGCIFTKSIQPADIFDQL